MYKNQNNTFKTATIILSITLILVLGYITYDKYTDYQTQKLQQAVLAGYNQGVTDSVTKLFQDTNNCQVGSIFMEDDRRNLVDVSCLQQNQ